MHIPNYNSTGQELDEVIERMHPLARDAFQMANNMNEASKRFIYQSLANRFADACVYSERETSALSCYYRALEGTGRSELGEDGYTRWYEAQPAEVRETLMSGPTIRRVFRGWRSLRSAAHAAPRARFKSRRRRALGPKFTSEELGEILRQFAEDCGGVISGNAYPAWADQKDREGMRVPRSFRSIEIRFRTRTALYVAAGLGPRSFKSTQSFSDEEIIRIVKEAASEVDGELTTVKYSRWRELARTRGRRLPVPSVIAGRFGAGSWAAAREAILALPFDSAESVDDSGSDDTTGSNQ